MLGVQADAAFDLSEELRVEQQVVAQHWDGKARGLLPVGVDHVMAEHGLQFRQHNARGPVTRTSCA